MRVITRITTLLILAIISVATLAAFRISGGAASEPLHYEPALVKFSGILTLEKHYGPPNFGETPNIDQVVMIPILELDVPISVAANQNDKINKRTFAGLKRVQIVSLNTSELSKLSGKHITVEGSLFERHSSQHFTEVLIQAKNFEPVL